jgi:predicted RNase H-like HicB family nuclease
MSDTLQLTITYDEPDEDGWIVARVVQVPGAMSQGRTREEARENVIDALRLMLAPDDDADAGSSEPLTAPAKWRRAESTRSGGAPTALALRPSRAIARSARDSSERSAHSLKFPVRKAESRRAGPTLEAGAINNSRLSGIN